ncbi:hypothetical protein BH11PLA2_BH11PLA2_37290 [soil metagenome]
MATIIDLDIHLTEFVKAFVIGAKKDRWLELLTRRGRNAHHDSHKLQQALDDRFCTRTHETDSSSALTQGVYFDFHDEPVVISEAEANSRNNHVIGYRDAIFSVEPGRLAYFFFHEGWTWRCQR